MQRHHDQPTTTVAVLGADTVVRRALTLLLEGHGYRTGVLDELLGGSHLLLLSPRLGEGVRMAFLGAMGKSAPSRASMPVIALSTAVEESLLRKEGVISVP